MCPFSWTWNREPLTGFSRDQPPRVDRHTTQEFENLLSTGLKRNSVLPKDPQIVPVNKPSVYVYTYYRSVYDITAFLHHDLPFARKLSPFNNKVTVGSKTVPGANIWKSEDLIKQDGFRTFFLSKFNRPGYTLKTAIQAQPNPPIEPPFAFGSGGRWALTLCHKNDEEISHTHRGASDRRVRNPTAHRPFRDGVTGFGENHSRRRTTR